MDDQVPDFTAPAPLPSLQTMQVALLKASQMAQQEGLIGSTEVFDRMRHWLHDVEFAENNVTAKAKLVCAAANETTFIETMLVLSTGHIRKKTSDWLANHAGLFDCPIGIENLEYGWLLYMPTAPLELPEVPEELGPIIDLALKLGTRKVLLDQDGETYPDLPTYDWE